MYANNRILPPLIYLALTTRKMQNHDGRGEDYVRHNTWEGGGLEWKCFSVVYRLPKDFPLFQMERDNLTRGGALVVGWTDGHASYVN